MYVSGWMGPGLTRKNILIEKVFKNSPILVLVCCGNMPITCVICSNIHYLKRVNLYDLSIISISVIGFQKKCVQGMGWLVELYPGFLGIF